MRPILPLSLLLTVAAAVPAVLPVAQARPRDRDHDGMPDRWEQRYGLSTTRDDARGDRDRDGLRNLAEYRAHTSPRRRDSDRDGETDGAEHAGTVLSFADGVLTVALPDGSALTGRVTSRTEIECPAVASASREDEGEDHEGDDDHGGSDASGRDDDEHGEDHEDDEDRPAGTTTTTTTGTTTTTTGTTPGDGSTPAPTVPGDDDEDEDEDRGCDSSALVAGAPVREAELRITSAGRRFSKVELGRATTDAPAGSRARR